MPAHSISFSFSTSRVTIVCNSATSYRSDRDDVVESEIRTSEACDSGSGRALEKKFDVSCDAQEPVDDPGESQGGAQETTGENAPSIEVAMPKGGKARGTIARVHTGHEGGLEHRKPLRVAVRVFSEIYRTLRP